MPHYRTGRDEYGHSPPRRRRRFSHTTVSAIATSNKSIASVIIRFPHTSKIILKNHVHPEIGYKEMLLSNS